MMNIYKWELYDHILDILVKFIKSVKPTFIVMDTINQTLYGFDGEEYNNNNYLELGVLKYIHNSFQANYPPAVFYSKDILALQKLKRINTNLLYMKDENELRCYPLKIVVNYEDDKLGNNIEEYPILDSKPFINKYLGILSESNFDSEIDISEYPKVSEMLSLKASDGGKLININNTIIFGVANMLHLNKGDSLFVSSNNSLIRYRVQKKKSKDSIYITYRYLPL